MKNKLPGKCKRKFSLFKGQKGQDKWVIFTALPLKIGGFFLDIAASDGITHSNTYALEKFFGWKGICVEPNPGFMPALRKNRNCIIDSSVISSKAEEVLFRVDNGLLGGIVDEDTDNSYRVRGKELAQAQIITMDAVLVNDLLDRHQAPNLIDYFSLDVEGSEERVISTLDFDRYQFQCITIERPSPRVNEILFRNGYAFVKNSSYDSFYVHSSLAAKRRIRCQPFKQVPAKDW